MKFFGKCAVVLAVMLALPMTLTAQIKVTHGPWLTDMSDTGVTIMWKTGVRGKTLCITHRFSVV